jgi:hypothetical protein
MPTDDPERFPVRCYPVEFIDSAIIRLTEAYPEWREKYVQRCTSTADEEWVIDEDGDYVYRFRDDIGRFINEVNIVGRSMGIKAGDSEASHNFFTDVVHRILQLIRPEIRRLQALKKGGAEA